LGGLVDVVIAWERAGATHVAEAAAAAWRRNRRRERPFMAPAPSYDSRFLEHISNH
jgi:hypothetical protein